MDNLNTKSNKGKKVMSSVSNRLQVTMIISLTITVQSAFANPPDFWQTVTSFGFVLLYIIIVIAIGAVLVTFLIVIPRRKRTTKNG